jgi:hypothetical protein
MPRATLYDHVKDEDCCGTVPRPEQPERTTCQSCGVDPTAPNPNLPADAEPWMRELHKIDMVLGNHKIGELSLCHWCRGLLRDFFLEEYWCKRQDPHQKMQDKLEAIKKIMEL